MYVCVELISVTCTPLPFLTSSLNNNHLLSRSSDDVIFDLLPWTCVCVSFCILDFVGSVNVCVRACFYICSCHDARFPSTTIGSGLQLCFPGKHTHTLPAPLPCSRESLSLCQHWGRKCLASPGAVLRPVSPLVEKGSLMHEPVEDTCIVLWRKSCCLVCTFSFLFLLYIMYFSI